MSDFNLDDLRRTFAGKSDLDRLRLVVALMAETGQRVTRIRTSARHLCSLESLLSHNNSVKSCAAGLTVTMIGRRVGLALNESEPKATSVFFDFELTNDPETKGWRTVEDFSAL